MEHDKLVKSHGILPILPPDCTKFVVFSTTKKLSIGLENLHCPMFPAKRHYCKIEKRDCHEKSRNSHGKVMEKYFVKSVGTPIQSPGIC